ncbi:hypothetical protein BTJ68_00543 [Hortaea werneckii EXF-2000]|uniref:Uncharacterized protein n=2 Tax=Hortaea werneckii TaxID=91943 RepID=A0A3M7ILM4_HORWE|nr:hypothetical protein BTJ68_00543 [Hortaea werneckii EXF-2000]RMZ26394.1 hypothetical protein D0859_09534 [Hortaea werneckii]
MSPNQKHHVRSTSHGRKLLPAHARPSKPPSLKRGNSYNNAATQAHAPNANSSRSGHCGSKKAAINTASYSDEEQEDMAGFLQFCATCERQIVTPCGSILYCSEACRRKDVSHTTLVQNVSPTLTPAIPATSEAPNVDIIPQRSPTVLRPLSLTFSDLSISSPESPTEDSDNRSVRNNSDAFQSLARIHDGTWQEGSNTLSRPRLNRASTESTGLPSLIHSPSSSVGTAASFASARPIPSRHNKSYSATSNKSYDLVTPQTGTSPTQLMSDSSYKSTASTLTSFRVAEAGELSYEKRSASRRRSEAQGSLKQLFSHEAMKAPPI